VGTFGGGRSFGQGFHTIAIELAIGFNAAGDAQSASFKDETAVAFVGFWEKDGFVDAALVFEGDEHHVAIIFCADVAISDDPAAESDTLAAKSGEFVAPGFAVTRKKIERMAADADFQDFAFVTEFLLESVFGGFKAGENFFRRRHGRFAEKAARRFGETAAMKFFLQEIPLPEKSGTSGWGNIIEGAALDEGFDFVALDGNTAEEIFEREVEAVSFAFANDVDDGFETETADLHEANAKSSLRRIDGAMCFGRAHSQEWLCH
jgi:hypothetical protein